MTTRRTFIVPLIAVVSWLSLGYTSVAADPQGAVYLKSLSGVKAAELPGAAALAVTQAPEEQQNAVAESAIQTVAQIRMAAVIPSVGAISKAAPASAASAAGTAAELLPKQVVQIVKAAATSAPEQAGNIVHAVCEQVPESYQLVATVAAKIAPNKAEAILAAVGKALPKLEPYIASASSGNAAVPTVLSEARASAQASSSRSTVLAAGSGIYLRGPAVGPPYIPLTGTPGNSNPGGSVDVPPGGRDYSKP